MRHQQKKIVRKMKKVMTFIVRKNVLLIVLFFLGFTCCVNAQSNDLYLLFDEQSDVMFTLHWPYKGQQIELYVYKMISKGENVSRLIQKHLGLELSKDDIKIASNDWNVHFVPAMIEKKDYSEVPLKNLKNYNIKDMAWLRSYFFEYYYDMINGSDEYMYLGRITRDFQTINIVKVDSSRSKAHIIPVTYTTPPTHY